MYSLKSWTVSLAGVVVVPVGYVGAKVNPGALPGVLPGAVPGAEGTQRPENRWQALLLHLRPGVVSSCPAG